MKRLWTILTLWLTIITGAITTYAQKPQSGADTKSTAELPTLQEWWRAPESMRFEKYGGMSYLPNFKDGRGALAITKIDRDETWMLKFPGDTQNVFTWQKGSAIRIQTGDFNGDGVQDYIDAWGNIYRGLQNGQPPSIQFNNYSIASPNLTRRVVADFNGDGFDDVFIAGYIDLGLGGQPNIAQIIFGGEDLSKLRLIQKAKAKPSQYYEEAVAGIYRATDNSWRMVCYWDDYIRNPNVNSGKGGFVLYQMYILLEGDSARIELTELDRTTEQSSGKKSLYIPSASRIYKSSNSNNNNNNASLITVTEYNNAGLPQQIIFTLVNDKIQKQDRVSIPLGTIIPSIDGDEHEDIIGGYSNNRLIFSGGDRIDTLPKARVGTTCDTSFISFAGDVNNDGVGDLVFMRGASPDPDLNEKTNCLSIILGQTPTDISESETLKSFSLEQSIPHPVSSQGIVLLPVNIGNSGIYSLELFNLKGQHIATVFNGFLEIGKQNLTMNPALYNTTFGTYTLRLSNGTQSVEKTFIITE